VVKDDIVFIVTNPAPLIILTSIAKLFSKFKLVILVHDIFPENLPAAGIKLNKILYSILVFIFNKAYQSADRIIVIGRDMQEIIKLKVKDTAKVNFIPNFANTVSIMPDNKNNNIIVKELNLQDKFIVLFTGNIGRVQAIHELVKAIILLKDEVDIHFIFIGDGSYKPYLLKSIIENKLHNIDVLSMQPRDRSDIFLNAGDVGLVSLNNISGVGVPSKTY
jgi:glycosyltransferase involved in cell wall biosynthesis